MAGASKKPHVLAFPFPIPGHTNSLMHFCRRLAACDVTITYASNPSNMKLMHQTRDLIADPHAKSNVRIVEVSDDPGNSSNDLAKGDPSALVEKIRLAVRAMAASVRELIRKFQEEGNPVCCMITDTFNGFTQDLADEFGIPRAVFWTSNAISDIYHLFLPELMSKGFVPVTTRKTDELIAFLPGCPPMPATDLPLAFYYDHPILGVICDGASRFAEARFALCNSYEELEPHAVATLRSEVKSSYFPIGPCLSPAFFAGESTAVERSSEHLSPEDLACLEWLDTQKESSVIYVSFGSVATMSVEQFQELARGLERSNQPFVLVLRKTLVADPSVHDFFEGLKQRIGERGIVISWAPQMHVLLHPAVGGFLTHCGWNSTVEGICAGVPMLAWPCMAEQNINCKELVEHWKLAIPVQDDRDKSSVISVSSERLADLVARLMRGDEGHEMRARAREFRKVTAAAIAEGGSSDRNLKAFAQALRDLQPQAAPRGLLHPSIDPKTAFRENIRSNTTMAYTYTPQGHPTQQYQGQQQGFTSEGHPIAPPAAYPQPPPGSYYGPGVATLAPPNSGLWTTGLCGCTEDCPSCWCAWCCPCVLVGRMANILDQGMTLVHRLWLPLQLPVPCKAAPQVRTPRGALQRHLHRVLVQLLLHCPGLQGAQEPQHQPGSGYDFWGLGDLCFLISDFSGYEFARAVYEQPPQVQEMRKIKKNIYWNIFWKSYPLMADEQRLHVAVLPTAGSGHINPMLELCRRLVPLGFQVTFVYPSNLCPKLESSLRHDDLHFQVVPSPASDKLLLMDPALQEDVTPVLEALRPPVKCLIADMFLGWSQDVAESLGIPRVAFIPSDSVSEAMCYHIPELVSMGFIPGHVPANADPNPEALIDFIPGLEPFTRELLPLAFQHWGPIVTTLGVAARRTKDAVCIVVNTIEELDQEVVNGRRLLFSSYLPVGPLVPAELLQEQHPITLSSPNDTSMIWLDKQAYGSVLYIAFGSVVTLPADQVEKIARAVKATRQPVLWAIRRNFAKDVPENFYESLQEIVGEQACLVVEWAPQVNVLRHSAVGAFLMHGGWNSALEALCCGVPMLCWPCDNDQNLNALTIVKKWRTGIMVAHGPKDDVRSEDLGNVIDAVMNGEEGRRMRSRAQELKKIVRAGTCLERNLRQFKDVIIAASQ
ncbi:uncharacterized protein LOC9640058 [Selaginella moellendorffii]|uniref:uncharacterized protein LOC9640058 n=1 Tax=Selaginella moellendorffii TaxID=88036 RepID=UPI000D1C4B6A|nr:uncharacterized protein LOC9640058 [Selaginella moellendorffii]|eukprot:XP_024532365.1 uncharacterized protein LOC9640058 [Selaginella moellendorffii]